jgi:DNA-binding GntR family transcriptional regulator
MAAANHAPIARALAYLRRFVAEATARRQHRLPPIRDMARDAGVSHGIMNNAVARLAEEGSLLVSRSRGVTIAQQDRPESTAAPSGRRWQRLRRQIQADLAAGRFGFNVSLPQSKQLQHRYGISPLTLRRALRSMVADGVIESHARGYRPCLHASSSSQNRIALFTRGTVAGTLEDFTNRVHNSVRFLEQECLAHGLLLQPYTCYFAMPMTMKFIGQDAGGAAERDLDACLGFMIWPTVLHETFLQDLLYRVTNRDKPLAVFWDDGSPERVPLQIPARRMRHFRTQDSFEAGRTVGLYLLRLGHCRVRCFSAVQRQDWTSERIAGIRRAYADAGMGDAVRAISADIPDVNPDAAEGTWAQPVVELSRSTLSAMAAVLSLQPRETTRNALPNMLVNLSWQELLLSRLVRAFDDTLADRRTTAWVGLDDNIASLCLNYLHGKRVDVPREISVVGFDDSAQAMFNGLSSYSFNGAAAMHAMVDYLVAPRQSGARVATDTVISVSGFVHERGSSGPAQRT